MHAVTRRQTRRTGLAVAVVLGLAALPLILTIPAGAFGVPRNDDWAYSDLLWRWEATGDLRLAGWESMTLVGQLLLAWPLAALLPRHVASLQVFTLVVGAVGALAAYATVRRFVSMGRAVLAVATTLVSPLYGPIAVSFMTDVPAFTAQAVCVWLGSRALSSRTTDWRGWFIGAMAVGVWGVTIREYAVVAPATVFVVVAARAWGRRDRDAFIISTVTGALAALFIAAFVAWRRTWEASLSLDPALPDGVGDAAGSVGRSAAFTTITLAFLVLPAFAFVPVRRLVRDMTASRWSVVAVGSAVIVLVAGAVATWEWSPPLLGPYLDQRGALGNDILPGDRALILPEPLLFVVLAVTLLAAVGLVGLLALTAIETTRAPTWRDRCATFDTRTMAWVLVVLTVLSLTAAGAMGLPIFDRYVLPAVPFAAALVLAWRPASVALTDRTPAGAARWLGVAAFFVLGAIWTVDAARFDATRWAAGDRAVQLGYPPDRVDTGFEWRNVHRLSGEPPMSPSQRDLDACVRLAAADADLGSSWTPLFTVGHWHGAAGTDSLTAWATDAPGCPPLP